MAHLGDDEGHLGEHLRQVVHEPGRAVVDRRAELRPCGLEHDRHAVLGEQSGVMHSDEQPLGDHLAVRAPELGHIGVGGVLLARHHEIRVDDGRFDHRSIVDLAGRLDEGAGVDDHQLGRRRVVRLDPAL